MLARLLTGISLASVVCLSVIFLPVHYLKILVAVLAAIGSFECARMVLPSSSRKTFVFSICLSFLFCLFIMFQVEVKVPFLFLVPFGMILTFCFFLFNSHDWNQFLQELTGSIFTVVYCGVLFAFLGLIRGLSEDHGWVWLLLLLACNFAADTAAYFSGKYLGRHKLAPRVSPGKTVEGFIGGIFGSILAAFIVKLLFPNPFTIVDCILIGTIVGIVGPLGDLSESMLKRSVGVKDSGKILPGHGGLLDRVDALLFSAPAVYYYTLFLR